MSAEVRNTVSVGVVGFGMAGSMIHAPLARAAGMSIRAVATRRPDAVAAALPGVPAVPDIESLLELPELDIVVIATPNDRHEAQAITALRADKCVVVDKPLAPDLAAADRILETADRSRGALTVFQNRRWDADFLTVQRVIANRTLGSVHTFESRWERFRPAVVDRWRERAANGGGLLLDLGSHLIDQALLLFGMPDWIQADVLCRRPGAQVEDGFEIRLAQGDRRIVLAADSLVSDPGPRFRLHGELGSFTKRGFDVQESQLRGRLSPLDPQFGVEPPELSGRLVAGECAEIVPVQSERGRWTEFYTALRSHVERGTPLPVDPADAREVLRLIDAARRSAASGSRIRLR
jgi:scyllo-inositol 2-dehydrogenase (NADP+)